MSTMCCNPASVKAVTDRRHSPVLKIFSLIVAPTDSATANGGWRCMVFQTGRDSVSCSSKAKRTASRSTPNALGSIVITLNQRECFPVSLSYRQITRIYAVTVITLVAIASINNEFRMIDTMLIIEERVPLYYHHTIGFVQQRLVKLNQDHLAPQRV